ncbi:unnamed protein product [Calicophoron daubneyi]|uniref:Uncharacterized protein n=1 Tax=Calicophoron daubneyi TaxID=300641 RepID=A0AAV2T886_CALDB
MGHQEANIKSSEKMDTPIDCIIFTLTSGTKIALIQFWIRDRCADSLLGTNLSRSFGSHSNLQWSTGSDRHQPTADAELAALHIPITLLSVRTPFSLQSMHNTSVARRCRNSEYRQMEQLEKMEGDILIPRRWII